MEKIYALNQAPNEHTPGIVVRYTDNVSAAHRWARKNHKNEKTKTWVNAGPDHPTVNDGTRLL